MNPEAIGKQIRDRRIMRRMTRRALAEAAGVSASWLGQIERGARGVSDEALQRIASALHVVPGALAGVCTGALVGETIDAAYEMDYAFLGPVDRFAVIRRELDLLEAEYRGTRLT